MISNKELNYVSAWATKTPYPGADYAKETMDILEKCFEKYNDKYRNKKYDIYFSNGNEIELEIQEKNLAHMLGIDYKNLSGDYFTKFRQDVLGIKPNDKFYSYGLLQAIIEQYDNIARYEQENKYNVLNYYRLRVKCAIFSKIVDLESFNYGCLNFDKNIYEKINDRTISIKSDKFLFVPSKEINAPYFMMGILNSNDNNNMQDDTIEKDDFNERHEIPKYAVETLFALTDTQIYFKGQKTSIPTQLLCEDGINHTFTKKEASAEEKLKALTICKELISLYNVNTKLDILNDYELTLHNEANLSRKRS